MLSHVNWLLINLVISGILPWYFITPRTSKAAVARCPSQQPITASRDDDMRANLPTTSSDTSSIFTTSKIPLILSRTTGLFIFSIVVISNPSHQKCDPIICYIVVQRKAPQRVLIRLLFESLINYRQKNFITEWRAIQDVNIFNFQSSHLTLLSTPILYKFLLIQSTWLYPILGH